MVHSICLLMLAFMLGFSGLAGAQSDDEAFARKFASYRARNGLSTLKTAEAFAHLQKKPVDAVLKRYIQAQWTMDRNAELAIVYGVQAYQEKGLSFDQALQRVSDLTGQMTSTLASMYHTTAPKVARRTNTLKKKSIAAR